MRKDYYVYSYLDKYSDEEYYLDLGIFEFFKRPTYIGKGTGDRYKTSGNQKIKKYNYNKSLDDVETIIIKENLTEEQALFIESYLIDSIGLKNLSNKISGKIYESFSYIENDDDLEMILECHSYKGSVD